MNPIPDNIMKLANEAAIYNLYLYLVHIKTPKDSTPLRNIIMSLSNDYKNPVQTDWNARDFFIIRSEPKTIKPSGELQELRAHRTWSGEHGHQPVRRTP